MLHRIHKQFGTAGLIVAVAALIAALAGGALAATGGLTAKQKKEVKKIAKSFQGTGPAGAAGANGTNGTNGKDGTPGEKGKDGTNGKNVVTGTEPTGTGNCAELGGATVEVEGTPASKKYACNGKEGSPWTAGGKLPPGATETGGWTLGEIQSAGYPAGFEGIYIPISFPISLADPLSNAPECGHPSKPTCQVHFVKVPGKEVVLDEAGFTFLPEEISQTECPGSAAGPIAEEGNLCVYVSELANATSASNLIGPLDSTGALFPVINPGYAPGASEAGAIMSFPGAFMSGPFAYGWGSWAVTG